MRKLTTYTIEYAGHFFDPEYSLSAYLSLFVKKKIEFKPTPPLPPSSPENEEAMMQKYREEKKVLESIKQSLYKL